MSGLVRIIWHWSAGTHECSDADLEHYHFAIDGDGVIHAGDHTPEDNISTDDDDYAAHVKNKNTGSIGVAVCAMANAVESPFNAGAYPVLSVQINSLIKLTVDLCTKYNIPVGRTTTLSHAEVEPTLGVQQDGKWDISWLPGMHATDDPVSVGDTLRAAVKTNQTSTFKGGSLEDRVSALEAWRATM